MSATCDIVAYLSGSDKTVVLLLLLILLPPTNAGGLARTRRRRANDREWPYVREWSFHPPHVLLPTTMSLSSSMEMTVRRPSPRTTRPGGRTQSHPPGFREDDSDVCGLVPPRRWDDDGNPMRDAEPTKRRRLPSSSSRASLFFRLSSSSFTCIIVDLYDDMAGRHRPAVGEGGGGGGFDRCMMCLMSVAFLW